jgi:peptide/nickel transport system permease protein
MARFLLYRLVRLLLVFVLVSILVSLLVDLTPGEPAEAIAGDSATPAVIEAINARYGFDRPPVERWADWMGGVVTGDFGESFASRQPVVDSITDRLPVTVELALLATLLALLLVVPLALYAGFRQGSRLDKAVNTWASMMVSIPSFVMALLLISLFALATSIFPPANWVPLSDDLFGNLRSAFLPALTLALSETAVLLPVLRADVISTLEQDYITLARSKGISSARLLFRHALRPSSISLVTLAGLSTARLFGGTVIVESVFNLQGLGRLLVNSIRSKDLVVTQGVVMFIAIVYLSMNFLVDVLYSRLDPRVTAR